MLDFKPNRVADPGAVLFYGLIALLTFAPLFWAGNRPLALLVMELAALALLAWRFWSPPAGGQRLSWPVWAFLALLFLLPLAQLLACVQARAPAPYTRIGMNLYRDGHDSVAMHGDKLHTVAAGHPITLVSLGAPRRMLIRAREGRRETLAVDLAPGSVLSMSHASQSTHEHGIPKTRRAQGPRISVVFRVRPA